MITVMRSALNNLNAFMTNSINQPIFLVNSSAPESSQVSSERFRFSDADMAVAIDILDQIIDLA